ncbi:damage-inducible mutagenesis protein [Lichenicola cladoniae]|uniref:Damage-inducible mutagenesis protein n=1 Tax=Lichenicola cladoniae TaxID=1484109 RepID=A0A6M8HVF1_9PROT|nr:damage-inducible mutagenesis protein [Lichenicola cladoniae]NPD66651.1 damage-inducible mutagenesis protein [Acetobacteraceae bacterium]QKE92280.1 damage-inducible mutagenesis protein [Lichenicola cladoniae]
MQTTRIMTLRAEVAALERGAAQRHAAAFLPFELAPIDRHLPGGGLALGAIHEVAGAGPEVEHGAAPALFAAGLLARCPGPVLWIHGKHDLFSEGLTQAGLDPGRLVLVHARQNALQAMEEGLRHPDLAGVVCELEGRLDLVTSRRLQLAAEATDVLGLVLRRSRKFNDPALVTPSAASSRWRISGAPSPPPLPHAPDVQGVGRPVWKLELLRCRGAEPATWIVEGCDAQGHLALAPILADRQAAPGSLHRASA